jgi:N-acetylglucosaminyldiphosphoundecaprenol N-acetyl-beta-D-mannosaminyltransferase
LADDADCKTSDFLGLTFDRLEADAAVGAIVARDPAAPFAYVVTPNVDHVVRLSCNRSDLWPAYRHAWLTLCDSRILAKLAARAGVRLPVVPGSDVTQTLFRDAMARSDLIAIVGGSAALVDDLRMRYGFTRLLHYNPPMGFIRDPAERARAADFVVAARARYTFLAVGSPQQELLAQAVARTEQGQGVAMCVGASLEFLVGAQTRAPRIVQRLALEWLYRLATDPARLWRRYLVEGPLIFLVFRQWRQVHRRKS